LISTKSIGTPEGIADLLGRLENLRPETPRRWGALTSGEMLCHLADVTFHVLHPPEAVRKRSRRLYKWTALYMPFPWPHGIRTPDRVNPRTKGTRPGDFEEDRRRVVEGLRTLASLSSFPDVHPVFGTMNTREWRIWAYRHTDHHLKQFGL
jgi:hypothetical protein